MNAILLVSDPSLSSRRSVGDDPLSQSLQDWTLQKTNRSAENGSKVRCPKKLRIGLPVNNLFLELKVIQRQLIRVKSTSSQTLVTVAAEQNCTHA